MADVVGTNGNDTLSVSGDDSTLMALAGNDLALVGPGLRMTLNGGTGHDRLTFIDRNTLDGIVLDFELGRLHTGSGDDQITATISNFEQVEGSFGNDLLRGADTADALQGERGNDTLVGRGGNDELNGTDAFSDRMTGGAGNDTILRVRALPVRSILLRLAARTPRLAVQAPTGS